ncbi:MarC family protein [Teredinibacter sp. KSP-S5-2]|uniref:MarC family protein n=1 Tax=Teredinibacter sp. KSP-S5-2 TaxID=3034506 RepID=UPI002934FFD1|nr:MarC family protein [Teredinibacter sp. KSP-S5-2]WNO08307.1 MarC family protein [Teredinibacter sp. KSP-S5-2]
MLDLTEYSKFFISLFAIVDPLSAIPIFITLTRQQTREQQLKTARLTAVGVFAALLVALLLGEWILWGLGISIDAFRCAGGIVLLLMGLEMLTTPGYSPKELQAAQDESVALVPLTMPLLAGPGAMSAVIVYAHQSNAYWHYLAIIVCFLLLSFSLWLCFRFLPWFRQHLSERTILMSTRVMGLLLVAIAVEFIASGVKGLFSL